MKKKNSDNKAMICFFSKLNNNMIKMPINGLINLDLKAEKLLLDIDVISLKNIDKEVQIINKKYNIKNTRINMKLWSNKN